jgi:hypothetical protein
MSESFPEQLRDEFLTKVGGKLAEKTIDKTIEIATGHFGKKWSIELSFSILLRLFNQPLYDETIIQFEKTLAEFRMRSSSEILEYNGHKYQEVLGVREITDPMAPFIANPEDELAMEQFLSSELRCSSAVVYLSPLVEETLKTTQISSLMADVLAFAKELRARLEKAYVPIRRDITFCRVTVYSIQMTELMNELRKVIPSVEAVVVSDEKRSVTVALTDSSIIGILVAALEKAL